MEQLLVINTSPQRSASYSRQMTERFVRSWRLRYPSGEIVYRELGNQPIPHVDERWVQAAFTPPEGRDSQQKDILALSDELVSELKQATQIVIGCPMHNLSVPSTLKAYIDQIIRMGITTRLVPGTPGSPYAGLLLDKKAYLLLVRGGHGYGEGGAYIHMNFQEPYLTAVLGMLGIHDVATVSLEYTAIGGDQLDEAVKRASSRIDALLG
ncbi:NAD(P)H-dependent oxidoreductase [Pseudomonas sp. KSR10]|uniref:FMN-dependent NADH-azoreductase n=1 Tax=Pseudomonas sp. KSR10 TaxID=2916654 RepID=UPI001EF8FE2E|nr:NAD(P)H-dependent oxidoreductase [Pseudomonas sp. KSR10]MCG6539748.1 NAD(P)H-dependent oxidoreductase [Pseudomonas sp. KSR10]